MTEEVKYKPIVQYKHIDYVTNLVVGQRTYVVPIDHTSSLVVNGEPALVSRIMYVGEGGYFETMSTRYVRVDD
jgi:hypothetical protein